MPDLTCPDCGSPMRMTTAHDNRMVPSQERTITTYRCTKPDCAHREELRERGSRH